MAELAYQIPDSGRAKRILRIPESHSLYLCPNACGRRQGIRALRNGVADNISFLRFDEVDVVSGDYERQVVDAVGSLLALLPHPPHAISLYVNCIDDFLGTDSDSLINNLEQQFDGVRFLLSHINPIAADVGSSTAAGIHGRLYDLLDKAEVRDRGIDLLGVFEPPPHDCELFDVLRTVGVGEVRHLVACETFDEYQALARSRYAISLSHLGDGAALQLGERLGIPSFRWHATYDIAEVERRYASLIKCLVPCYGGSTEGIDSLLSSARTAAEHALASACAAVGGMPLAVDTSASLMPFSLALALREAGFNVHVVFALHSKGCDVEAEKRLEVEYPDVTVIRQESYEAIKSHGFSQHHLAIGRDAAFLLHADHVVDMYHDEGFFGYQGIERLAYALVDAVKRGA